jgi:hypothetical protein
MTSSMFEVLLEDDRHVSPSSAFNPPGVTFIPIQPDPPPIDLVVAHPRGEPLPTVAAFLDMRRQQLPRIQRQYAYRRRRTGLRASAKIT